jgi:hypothetical protein
VQATKARAVGFRAYIEFDPSKTLILQEELRIEELRDMDKKQLPKVLIHENLHLTIARTLASVAQHNWGNPIGIGRSWDRDMSGAIKTAIVIAKRDLWLDVAQFEATWRIIDDGVNNEYDRSASTPNSPSQSHWNGGGWVLQAGKRVVTSNNWKWAP